jgi:hypothetical protein
MIRWARIDVESPILAKAGFAGCSVLWLIPTEVSDLGRAMATLASEANISSCVGVLCRPSTANAANSLSTLLQRNSVVDARVVVGGTEAVCEVMDVQPNEDVAFWELFGRSSYQRQLCGGLFYGAPPSLAWEHSAIQLALMAGAGPLQRLAAAHDVQDVLLEAFVAETMLAGGAALTKVVPEMYRAGLAVSGTKDLIERLESVLQHAPRLDETEVRHSVELGGSWPR